MEKLYYYPSAKRKGYDNPYSVNFKNAIAEYYNVLDKFGMQAGSAICLLCHSFLADIFVLNWIESIAIHKFGIAQYWIVRLCFKIIKLRKKKIVWMFHNIHLHNGENKYSESIVSYLFKHADLIITHSKIALNLARNKARGRVEYICHPIALIDIPEYRGDEVKSCDVLIWGDIFPYKGVMEFISNKQIRESGLNIFIIGKCEDAILHEEINSWCSNNICYENRRASFEELKALISKSKYVLFPYIGDSVSSSGALIDTIMLGGTPIGPNVGAFKDLAEEHLCYVYNDCQDLIDILSGDNSIDKSLREKFIAENTWQTFARKLNKYLNGDVCPIDG